jgi:inorganic pyrophosphatase
MSDVLHAAPQTVPPRADKVRPMRDVSLAPDGGLICMVEIPKGSKNKYEYHAGLRGVVFDRLLRTAAVYPADYGFLPETLGEDGDPLDVLVCLSEPTFPGCLIPVRPIAVFRMSDEHGVDDKLICVPTGDPNWSPLQDLEDLPLLLKGEIEQFFTIYKQLEEGKTVTIQGWGPRPEAVTILAAAQARFAAGNAQPS